MSQLYKRTCTLIVDGLRFTGLRVQFRVRKSVKPEPNTAEIKVFNLSASTRDKIRKHGAEVILSAGYDGSAAVVFQGDARTIDHVREGAEWITKIACGDGERAYQWARFSDSFAPGTSIVDVIKAAAKALGIGTGNLDQVLGSANNLRGNLTQFANGYTAHGKASNEFDKLCRTAGLTWSIQNGTLQVLPARGAAAGQAVLLTPETGLIGSPEQGTPEKKGEPPLLKFKSLLLPQLGCGNAVEIRSSSARGQFRVDALDLEGDTGAAPWYTSGEARPL